MQHLLLFETNSPIVALEWSSSNVLVYMNIDYRVCFLNTEMLIEMETIDLSQSSLVYATLPKGKKVATNNNNNNNSSSSSSSNAARSSTTTTTTTLAQQSIKLKGQQARSFFNSIRSCDDDDRLYFLSHSDLQVAKLEKWTDRIRTLKNEGEWIEALLLGLEHYAFIHADDVVIDSNDDEDVADTNNNDDNLVGLNNITNSPVKTKMDDRIIADLLMWIMLKLVK